MIITVILIYNNYTFIIITSKTWEKWTYFLTSRSFEWLVYKWTSSLERKWIINNKITNFSGFELKSEWYEILKYVCLHYKEYNIKDRQFIESIADR